MRRIVLNVDLSPLDALYKLCEGSPSTLSPLKIRLYDVAFKTACLMDSALHVQFVQYEDSLEKLEFFLGYIGRVISSFDLKEMDQDTMADGLSGDMNIVSLLYYTYAATNSYSEISKPSRNYYPRTGQLGFIDHLVGNLDQLVKDKAYSIGPLKYFALELQRMLQLVSYGFMQISELRKGEADLKDLIQSITDLAYEARYVIDSFLVRDIDHMCHDLDMEIRENFSKDKAMIAWGEAHPMLFGPAWTFVSVSLCFRDILKELKQYQRRVKMECGDMQTLVSSIIDKNPFGFKIIPIVNDTEISKKLSEVFDHPVIRNEFSLRTWSLVSSYKERKKEVFLQLLQNASDDQKMFPYSKYTSEDKLEFSVHELVIGSRRSFIILKDVRDIDPLKDIGRVLLCYDCTVLLTTPSPQLAAQCHQKDFYKTIFYVSEADILETSSQDDNSTSQTNKPEDDVIGFKAESERMLELLIGGPI